MEICQFFELDELILFKYPYNAVIHRISAMPVKIPMAFFKNNYSKICMEAQKIPNNQSNPEKRKKREQSWKRHTS